MKKILQECAKYHHRLFKMWENAQFNSIDNSNPIAIELKNQHYSFWNTINEAIEKI